MVDSNEIINSIKNDMAEQENIFNQIFINQNKIKHLTKLKKLHLIQLTI